MLNELRGSRYASGLVFVVLTLLVYYCEFMYISYLIHLQTIFGQLWLAAYLNKREPAYSTLSGLIVGRGLILGVGW